MDRDQLLSRLNELNHELSREGFVIDALCGSFARNEEDEHSDIDLLYHVEKPFLDLHGGFDSFRELKRIKEYLQNRLNRPVDLIPMNNLSDTAKHYIVQECIDVR